RRGCRQAPARGARTGRRGSGRDRVRPGRAGTRAGAGWPVGRGVHADPRRVAGHGAHPAQAEGGPALVNPDLSGLQGDLLAALAERAPRVDRERAAMALEYAAGAHASQRRESGEPFLAHVVEVTRVLAEWLEGRLDTALVCAALLHDVVEDTDVSLADVRARFGEGVAALVEGVTKLSNLSFDRPESAQAENFRRMMLSMARDLRVIFI